MRDLSLFVQYPLSVISNKRSLNFDFGAWAVPSTGTSLIFKGDVSIQRQLLWVLNTTSYILKCHVNSTSDMLPLDNAPGSKYDISQFGINIDSVNAQLHAQLGSWINANLLQKSFCFVPTVSSLALINPQQNLRASLCSNIPCLLPAQVTDYYAPQQNEIHVSYTNNNSLITLNASITNSCSPVTISSTNIVVGKVPPGPITFPLIDPTLGKLQAQVDPVPGATSYNWYKNGVLQTGHGGAIQMPITRNQCNVYYDISVASISICGISLQTHAEAYVPPCNNAFSVSPNPASNSINVSPVAGNSQLSANSAIDEIRVYDVQGNLKRDQKFGKAASASMNIQGLTNGSYYVEIISGPYSEKHQLVIQN